MSIEYRFENEIARIRFDDDKVNVMSTDWLRELSAAFDHADKDSAHAIIVRGRDGLFSGGLDKKWLATLDLDGITELAETFGSTMIQIWMSKIPTVAAVSGHAIAGGCILASACDARIGLRDGDYQIQMNEHLIRMPLPSWARSICTTAFPANRLEELLMLSVPFSHGRAHEIGMLHELAGSLEELDEMSMRRAHALKLLDKSAFAKSKQRARGAEAERLRGILIER